MTSLVPMCGGGGEEPLVHTVCTCVHSPQNSVASMFVHVISTEHQWLGVTHMGVIFASDTILIPTFCVFKFPTITRSCRNNGLISQGLCVGVFHCMLKPYLQLKENLNNIYAVEMHLSQKFHLSQKQKLLLPPFSFSNSFLDPIFYIRALPNGTTATCT